MMDSRWDDSAEESQEGEGHQSERGLSHEARAAERGRRQTASGLYVRKYGGRDSA